MNYLDGTLQQVQTPLDFAQCTSASLLVGTNITDVMYQRLGLDQFLCPTNGTYSIGGQYTDDNFMNLTVSIRRCIQSIDRPDIICATDDEIETTLNSLEVDFYFINTNFDTSNLTHPVKYLSARLNSFVGISLTLG